NYLKAKMFAEKMQSLYDRDKETGNQAFAEVKPLLEFYAEKQVPSAQYLLGVMYDVGFGVKEDKAEAMKWFRKAAEKDYAPAQSQLGLIYYLGFGVKQDYAEAVKWYRKAAEQGHAYAQYWLGYMYDNGYGVTQDYKTAYMWYFLAGLSGDSDANDRVRDLEKEGWFSSAKVSPYGASEAKAEARRKYDEIRKRYGLN
ncbi:MAG: sel1 repeat family protein, partial [Synergistaceae bacterium]|nr:sel1 repeat family protein [Synergistaceae bacterium]